MPTRAAQYLNEIVSLTIMALLIVALAAGESGAGTSPELLAGASGTAMVARQEAVFRHDGE